MSKLSEYSKFDNLDSSSEDDEAEVAATSTTGAAVHVHAGAADATPRPSAIVDASTKAAYKRDPITKRISFIFEGKTIYEWEQHLSDLVIYVPAPRVPTKQIYCSLAPNELKLGLHGSRPFLLESPYHSIEVSESTWVIEDDCIVIYLQKANKGIVWEAALKGRFDVKLNSMDLEAVKKEVILERWQLEHPGMDFRDAEFNGNVPDPRTFMGGVNYE